MRKEAKYDRNPLQNEERSMFGKDLSFAAAEAYKLLRTNILFALPDNQHKYRIIGVTSSSCGEGKSTTALNLSYMLAEAGEHVMLIEGDMRMPTISRVLNLQSSPGLSNILAGLSKIEDVLQESGLHSHLQIICSGDIPPNPSELLGAKSMGTLMEALAEDYDFIIFDLPPVTEVADPLVVSKLVDGMILVVRQNYVSRRALANTVRQLEYVNTKVLGFVMTHVSDGKNKKYYKRYGRYGRYGPA